MLLKHIINNMYRKLKAACVPGTSTFDLNEIAKECFRKHPNVVPGPSLYKFPGVICTSVNLIAAHGIPSKREILKEGDVIKIDICAGFKDSSTPHGSSGFIDSCRTFAVGKIKPSHKALITASEDVTWLACNYVSPGMTTGQLGTFIEEQIKKRGYKVLHDLMGHGIGDHLHMSPSLPNFAFEGGEIIKEGMTLAIEPVITVGPSGHVIKLFDGWTLLGSGVSAQTEHTVRVLKAGNEILI
jgi:methionyl aminopeptidase